MSLKKAKDKAIQKTLKPQIVFLATLSPEKCGIAKFTRDLMSSSINLFGKAVSFRRVAIMDKGDKKNSLNKEFIYTIDKFRESNYRKCAEFINLDASIKLISIQHEFGIFGGELGSYILSFLEEIKKPVFVTFHSVIPEPSKELLSLVKKIGTKAKKVVVMTERSKNILLNNYHFSKNKIVVIPHGVPSFSYEDSSQQIKGTLGIKNKILLFTHGFLSRNKGIEYVIDALPGVIKKFPKVLYVFAGRTHPNVKLQEGENYRNSLIKRINKLGIRSNVKFVNRYISTRELINYLKACDVYISTSLDPGQAVSGTLAYALSAGRPIISTDFSHSREGLKRNMGILVKPRNPHEYEKAVKILLAEDKMRRSMGMTCYFKTRNMTWQNVALSYGRIFSEYVPNVGRIMILPPLVLSHLFKMTDEFGLLQFAKLTKPQKKSGYTVDDNARALIVASMYYKKHQEKSVLRYVKTYLDFLKYTLDDSTGHFRNYVNYNRSFNEEKNRNESFEDSTSRAMYALAKVMNSYELPKTIRIEAQNILRKSLNHHLKFTYTHSIAFYLKSLSLFYSVWKKQKIKEELKIYADILHSRYLKERSKNWIWFENTLTYSNGVIPESLFFTYRSTHENKYLKVAEETANFLIRHSFKKEFCVPIGQKYWFQKGKKRAYFDQQPEEVASLVEMLKTAYAVTKEKKYRDLEIGAYNWFLGNNTLNQVICDFKTGGCYDGVGEKEVNLNQGAESTLAYLTARLIVSKR